MRDATLVMVKVRYLWQKGNNFSISCINTHDLDSKVLLSSVALEILGKAYLGALKCEQNMDDTEQNINKLINDNFKRISHDICKLYESIPELMAELGIKNIEHENRSGFIDEYRIYLKDRSFPLIFKTLEACRYGGFSTKNDVLILASRVAEELFLEKLSKLVSVKIKKVFLNIKE